MVFDQRREAHRCVDVALRDMEAEAVGDERHADHQQEAERQHDDRRVLLDKARQRIDGHHHHGHGDDDRDIHDRDLVGHADRGDDRIDREHQIEQQDLEDRPGDRDFERPADHVLLGIVRIYRMVDFLGCLPDEEQAAGDQDEIAPGEAVIEEFEDRICQVYDVGHRRQKQQPHHQRAADAETARGGALLFWQLVGENGNKDEVVDAEHDLEHDERQHGDPRRWIVNPSEMGREELDHRRLFRVRAGRSGDRPEVGRARSRVNAVYGSVT